MRADDEIRTRDPHLGKVMLYQLSHIRVVFFRTLALHYRKTWPCANRAQGVSLGVKLKPVLGRMA